MLGTLLSSVPAGYILFNLHKHLKERHHYFVHFMDERTEAQRRLSNCPQSHLTKQVEEPQFQSKESDSRVKSE